MKYFTLRWWRKTQDLNCPPQIINGPRDAYETYYRSIRSRLPKAVRLLEKKIFLSDATLINLFIDLHKRSLVLTVITLGGNARSHVLEIHYKGVSRFKTSAGPGKGLLGPNGYGDIGYYEIEIIDDDLFEQRVLFSSGIEFSFRFENVELFQKRKNKKKIKLA